MSDGKYYGEPAKCDPNYCVEKVANTDDPWRGRATGMKCSTCIWWVCKETGIRRDDGRGSVGRCRRHCPTMGGFPVVFSQDWCGDHRLDENKI